MAVSKPLLQKITILMAIVLAIAFLWFVWHSYQLDVQAQAIVAHNNRIRQEFSQQTKRLALQLYAHQFYYDRPLSASDQQKLTAIAVQARTMAKQLKQAHLPTGVNLASNNHADLVRQQLENYQGKNLVLASIAQAQICLNTRLQQLKQHYTNLGKSLSTSLNSDPSNPAQLKQIQTHYHHLQQLIPLLEKCIDQPLYKHPIHQALLAVIHQDQGTLQLYNTKLLQPLQQLYKQENYLGILQLGSQYYQLELSILQPVTTDYIAQQFQAIVENIVDTPTE